MIDPKLPQVSTHEGRTLILHNLPTEAKQAMVAAKIRKQDVVWLDTMLDSGCFDYSDDTDEMALITSVFRFLEMAKLSTVKVDPVHGALPELVNMLALKASDEFKDFYRRFVEKLMQQSDLLYLQGRKSVGLNGEPFQKYYDMAPEHQRLLSLMVIGACALDIPECVERVLQHPPYVDTNCFGVNILGAALTPLTPHADKDQFYPYFFAMQFSRPACMELIAKHRHSGSFGLTDNHLPGLPDTFGLVSGFGARYTPVCLPIVFEQALSHVGVHASETLHLTKNMKSVLAENINPDRFTPYLQSLVPTGFLEQDPAGFLALACEHGHGDLIRAIRSEVDWHQVPQGEHSAVIKNLDHIHQLEVFESAKPYEDAIEAFFDRAIADGHSERVVKCHARNFPAGVNVFGTSTFARPAHDFIVIPFHGALVKMLQAGLSPTAPPVDGTQSPLETANAIAASALYQDTGETAHLIRSFAARQQAMLLLDEIQTSSKPEAFGIHLKTNYP